MEKHLQLSDLEFETQFEDSSLSPSLFSHEAHLRLAWIHIKHYGVDQAIENICNQIKRFDQTHGDGTKFHVSITVVAVKVVDHFMKKSVSDNFQDFILEFPRLKYNFKDLVDAHYSFDLFRSKSAKTKFVEPDLLPFD